MAISCPILIDLREANLDLDRDQLENFLLSLADEMQSGDLVNEAHLARETDVVDFAKSGVAAFLIGVLTAEVNRENLGRLMDFLGNQFYGKTLTLSGEFEGMIYNIEYRNPEELKQAEATIERLANLHLKISEQKNKSHL